LGALLSEKRESFVDPDRIDFVDFGTGDILYDERVVIDARFQIGPRCVVGHDAAALSGLEGADRKENAIVESARDPGLVVFHEFASPAFVFGKFE
jgi:hypothetical protein